MSNMDNGSFMHGLGIGMAVGSAIGMAVKNSKGSGNKNAWGKALKSMGEAVENISGMFGM